MSDELALIDTNVLVYSLYGDYEHHSASRHLVDHAKQRDAGFCVTAQVIAEFYSVVTSPRRVTLARHPGEALEDIETILAMPGLRILPQPQDIISRWAGLVRRYPVTGQDIFDLQLIATMLGNGVRKIYTFNASDFAVFNEIEVITPEAAQSSRDGRSSQDSH